MRIAHLVAPSLVLCLLISTGPAAAANYTVNSLADNVTIDALCTLREAVAIHVLGLGSNDCGTASGVANTIDFSVNGTILLNPALGALAIAGVLEIDGPGAALLVIDGQSATTILAVSPASTMTLRDVTLQHGWAQAVAAGSCPGGGALRVGNCAPQGATVTVEDVLFLENSSNPPAGGAGGAIRALGILTVRRSQFIRNGGSIGGIFHLGDLRIEDSSFEENVGGAVVNGQLFTFLPGSASITSSLFRGNLAQGTTTAFPTAAVRGGASSVHVVNSTFEGNDATNGQNVLSIFQGLLTVANCTFANNVGLGATEGVIGTESSSLGPSTLSVDSSLFAANSGVTIRTSGEATVTTSFNLFDTAAGDLPPGTVCSASTAGGANLCGIGAPDLDALAANGGRTQTMALQSTSSAVHAGSNTGGSAFDQRGPGFPRTQGPATDIGAFETAIVPVQLLDFAIE